MNQWSVAGLTCVFIVLKTQTLSLDCRTSPNFIWFGRCDLNLLVWVDRTRLHSQHAFQQVCLYTLTWLLKSHSCGDRSHAVHCGSPSIPLLHRCSPLSFWPYCQYFSSCLLWPLWKKVHIFKSSCLKISENKPFCVNEANKSMVELMKKMFMFYKGFCQNLFSKGAIKGKNSNHAFFKF